MTTIIVFILLLFALFVIASIIDGEIEAHIRQYQKFNPDYQTV